MFTEIHVPQARLLHCGQVAPDPAWHIPRSRHAYHEMILVLDGVLTVASGGERVKAGAGSVLIYPAGVEHEEWSDARHPLRSLHVGFDCKGLGGMPVTLIQDSRQVIRETMARVYADRHSSSEAARLQRNAFLQAILAEFLRNLGTEDQPMVSLVRQHIRDHVAERLTLDGLARVCGLSKFHFLRQYRNATGRTPMEDVRSIRAEYARELVLSTRLPLKEIALRSGLGDEYSLSRTFRRLFDVPPGRYRHPRVER